MRISELMMMALVGGWTLWASPVAADGSNRLIDANFATTNGDGAAWAIITGKGGSGEPAMAGDGKSPALQLKNATAAQAVTLPAGLFELTVQARGQGELLLSVSGAGERSQLLGKDWGTYGYLFETDAGERAVTLRVTVDGTLAAAAIRPATEEQKTAWTLEKKSLEQFGFITVSAQRPSPGSAPLQFAGNVKPLEAMTRLAVLDEPRLNIHHAVNVDRLVGWLGDHGFERLDGLKLPAWMTERIERGEAYGSVVVLARGVTPAQLFEGPDDSKPLWLEYLRNGGRIVHVGNVPLGISESPLVKPDTVNSEARGMGLLNLQHAWHSPYCGQTGLSVTLAPAAKQWGIETVSGSWVGMPVENVSLAFNVFTVPLNGKQGASDWFRNVRPDMPWSGLVRLLFDFDGNNDAALRTIWRAAHYAGKPVAVPAVPPVVLPPPPRIRIFTTAGGMEGRHEFVRGEEVKIRVTVDAALKATDIRLELLQDGKALFSQTQPATNAQFLLDTAPFADSAYSLRAVVLQGDQAVDTNTETLGIRYLPPENFNFEIGYGTGANPRRDDLETADIRDAGMELIISLRDVPTVDVAVRNHAGFSVRLMPARDRVGDRKATFEENPEYFRLGPDGKPMADTGYSGERPMLGISHPEIREAAAKAMERGVREVAALPSFRPYVQCNDDFSSIYGWDYAPHVLAAFKADTGLESPRRMELPPKLGAIPDNNAWLQWFEWTQINVCGAYNKAETEGVLKARADARIGPFPGGMMLPLVSMWQPAQYPPYNFGKNGFNLISSYYYNRYWQPVMTTTFWSTLR